MDFLPNLVQNAYDIESAVGVQLDVLGKYAGVPRSASTPNGTINLTDDEYRTLIKVAITGNNAGSSLYDIQKIIATYFAGDILVFDYQTMRMGYVVTTAGVSLNLIRMIVALGLLWKPMGVQLSTTIYIPVVNNAFGFGSYPIPAFNVHGFNTYSVYDTNCPWISYANAV
jgi:hypothetical protein